MHVIVHVLNHPMVGCRVFTCPQPKGASTREGRALHPSFNCKVAMWLSEFAWFEKISISLCVNCQSSCCIQTPGGLDRGPPPLAYISLSWLWPYARVCTLLS